jgi:multimeric flavodoxin WrbA
MKNGGTCVQKDDFAGIAAKLLSCDVLVLASPVYYYSVTAQMKTMIDRCYSILSALKDKECYFISTAMSETKEYFQTAIVLRFLINYTLSLPISSIAQIQKASA